MGIKSIYTDTSGQVGVNPRRVKIISYDSLSAVTTAGYLSTEVLNTYAIVPTDIFDIVYSYSDATNSGTYGEFLPTFSAGIVTLSQAANSGITLPTIANHFAIFTNTTGLLGEDVATAINGGNIQAGLSGTAGTLTSFPATGSNGKMVIAAVNNAGNHSLTLSNISTLGQNTTLTFNDAGAATANVIVSTASSAQSISGGLTIATGNLGVTAGNVTAGSSGHAGTVTSFPATGSNGSFVFAAVNNASNFASTLNNSAVGQATVYTFPDPVAATGNVVVAPSALVSGNLLQASGTAGLVIDSGIAASGLQILSASVTLNQAAVQAMYATPFQIVAAPAAGHILVPVQATIYTNFQTAAFTAGGVGILQYGSSAHGAGTNALAATIPAAEITAGSSQIYNLGSSVATVLTGISAAGLFLSNQTGAFTGGNAASTVVVTVSYYLITATV